MQWNRNLLVGGLSFSIWCLRCLWTCFWFILKISTSVISAWHLYFRVFILRLRRKRNWWGGPWNPQQQRHLFIQWISSTIPKLSPNSKRSSTVCNRKITPRKVVEGVRGNLLCRCDYSQKISMMKEIGYFLNPTCCFIIQRRNVRCNILKSIGK